jgi:hypothetical protein
MSIEYLFECGAVTGEDQVDQLPVRARDADRAVDRQVVGA